jgi:colanic acid/amylovoran biosynthesis glycosyltransferase
LETTTDEQPVVAVFRTALLHRSEPYIRTQAEAVPGYTPWYVGTHRTGADAQLLQDRMLVLGDRYQHFDAALQRVLPLPARWRDAMQSGPLTFACRSAFQLSGRSPTLLRGLRRLRPALLHAHTGINGAHALPLARRLDLPMVVTFHGYDATASDDELHRRRTRGRVYLRRREALQRAALRGIAVSRFIADRLRAQGWADERVVVHYMGVDTHAFRPLGAPPAQREPLVFWAGRLIEKKGLEYAIDAMPAVQARVPGAQLVIAGHGERSAALQQRAVAQRANVRFVGQLDSAGVRNWLARASVYCMPSVRAANGDGEGVPTALIEAMACALPVVSTEQAGIPEAVRHGDTGLLAPERDAGALAEHLGTLLADSERRACMGESGRARVLELFDHRRQSARLAALYDGVRQEYSGRRHSPRWT